MLSDFALDRPDSASCSLKQLERIFVIVDSAATSSSSSPMTKRMSQAVTAASWTRQLTREEWLRAIMCIAIARHVMCEDRRALRTKTIAKAVEELLDRDIAPKLSAVWPVVPLNTNQFRESVCYSQEVTSCLASRLDSLRVIYDFYSVDVTDPTAATFLGVDRLMSRRDWLRCCHDLQLVSPSFTVREATVCFGMSRSHVVDDAIERSRRKQSNLSFEDFAECI
eukprot:1625817-Prymnesium_polylepis.1